MDRLFLKKSTSILTVVALLIVLVMLFTLLTLLTQKASLSNRAEKLKTLIEQSKTDNEAKQQLIDFMQTDEYVKNWALSNGLINSDDVSYIQQVTGK